MFKHVVIDLETLGTRPGAAVIEIGAVAFGARTDSRFQVLIRPDTRFEQEDGTLAWWKAQAFYLPDEAAAQGVHLRDALLRFQGWFEAVATEDTRVWGNSPSFDCSLLRECFYACKLETPWNFRMERDVRTLRDLMPPPNLPVPMTPQHRALNDALWEAEYIKMAYGAWNKDLG